MIENFKNFKSKRIDENLDTQIVNRFKGLCPDKSLPLIQKRFDKIEANIKSGFYDGGILELNLCSLGLTDIPNLSDLITDDICLYLWANDNRLVNLDFAVYYGGLYGLELTNNQIRDVSAIRKLDKCDHFAYLYLNSNKIKDLTPFKNFRVNGGDDFQLQLNDNKIIDIQPLKHLDLVDLQLNDNLISDISSLRPFGDFYIEHNHISDLKPLLNTILDNESIYKNADKLNVYCGGNNLTNDYIKSLNFPRYVNFIH